MRIIAPASVFFAALAVPASCQGIPFPNPPYFPPNASSGAQPSASSSSLPNPQWGNLLGNLLYFYEAQRSGNLTGTNTRVPWRNSSCVNDGHDVGLDLSGGYYDAGDYIKATFPLSFTLMSICWGGLDYGKGYDSTNQTAYLDAMVRYGLDYLIKAHSAPSNLYVLVGSTNLDDAYWGGDLNIPTDRPSYAVNDTHPGTDVAAGTAAAFAACSALYAGQGFGGSYSAPASLKDTTYAATLLQHAQQLHSFAVNATGGQRTYQTSVPAVAQSYGSSTFGDELTISALFLAWANQSTAYFQEALGYYKQYQLAGQNSVFNWDSKTPGVFVLFSQIAQSSLSSLAGNLGPWQTECERYFDYILNNQGSTRGGLLYYDGDSNDASLNPALNAAMLLERYSSMASSSGKMSSYRVGLAYWQIADPDAYYVLSELRPSPARLRAGEQSHVRQVVLLASSAMPVFLMSAVPYVVGSNPNSPSNPHSAMASGGNDIGNIDTSPAEEAYVLYGAVIGGPDQHDRFFDIRSDWPETEVALDYNAPMLTLAAMHAANDTADPYFTRLQAGAYVKPGGSPCDSAISGGCGGPHLSKGAIIAMAVVLSVVGVVILGLLIWYIRSLRSRGK
ncbi:unnamed protein product [Mycena citricolor]|uniref:Endoglucanase n=1 Tax=Mycena citricolor TaxID=2018698 RepID=A0AAD2K2R4_9AGAR|nr:unnamed protein product [Mycena citricolor]